VHLQQWLLRGSPEAPGIGERASFSEEQSRRTEPFGGCARC
jgi:hypothetical protein